jgi:hypothetical protein
MKNVIASRLNNESIGHTWCPVLCSLEDLEKEIKFTKKHNLLSDFRYLEGVHFCRVILRAATNGETQ